MVREDVTWHGDSWTRLSRYQFNTKQKDQLFCGRCGASIGLDFRESEGPEHPSMFGISVSPPCPLSGVLGLLLEQHANSGDVKLMLYWV